MNYKIEKYIDTIPISDKLYRFCWLVTYLLFFRYLALPFFNSWRIFLLKIFGAKLGKNCVVRSSAYIPSPKMLEMGEHSCLGPQVKLHLGLTKIGAKVTVSQRTYLCSATHEIDSLNMPLLIGEIKINDFVWIGAEAFIMSGVEIGQGAIIGARSAVFKYVEPWTIVGGNPAKYLKKREILHP